MVSKFAMAVYTAQGTDVVHWSGPGFSGVLSGLGSSTSSNSNGTAHNPMGSIGSASAQQQPFVGGQSMQNRTGPTSNSFGGPRSALHANNTGGLPSPMSTQSLINAQQAAMAAQQNWRNGLNSPNVAAATPDPSMVNNLAMMNTLAGLNSGMNLNGMANMAAMAKYVSTYITVYKL